MWQVGTDSLQCLLARTHSSVYVAGGHGDPGEGLHAPLLPHPYSARRGTASPGLNLHVGWPAPSLLWAAGATGRELAPLSCSTGRANGGDEWPPPPWYC